jgi:hypothetical protein
MTGKRAHGWWACVAALVCGSAGAANPYVIYDDALQNGWGNWSYSATIDPANAAPTQSGTASIGVVVTGEYGGLQLGHDPVVATAAYSALQFWVRPTTATTVLGVKVYLDRVMQPSVGIAMPAANTWGLITIPLAQLGAANVLNLTQIEIQSTQPGATPTFYVDNIMLVASAQATVASVSPPSGLTTGGTVVTITGANLTTATAVTFGGTAATSFTVNSDTQITATTAAHAAGAADVAVTTSGAGNATLAGGLTFNAPLQASIATVSPQSCLIAGGILVTITGTNLTTATAVTFGGTGTAFFYGPLGHANHRDHAAARGGRG